MGYYKEGIEKILQTRSKSEQKLRELGFHFPVSGTNFIFAAHEKLAAKEIFEALRSNNIYVRYFNAPRINNYLRITVGTDEEMDRLFSFLKVYIEEKR